MGIAQRDESEFGRGPQDHVLAEPGEVGADQCGGEEDLGDEVAITDCVHAVLADGGETELFRDARAVEDDRASRECAGAERHDVDAGPRIRQPRSVAA